MAVTWTQTLSHKVVFLSKTENRNCHLSINTSSVETMTGADREKLDFVSFDKRYLGLSTASAIQKCLKGILGSKEGQEMKYKSKNSFLFFHCICFARIYIASLCA